MTGHKRIKIVCNFDFTYVDASCLGSYFQHIGIHCSNHHHHKWDQPTRVPTL